MSEGDSPGWTGWLAASLGMLFFVGCCAAATGAATKAWREDSPVVAALFGVGSLVCVAVTLWFARGFYRTHLRSDGSSA